MGLKKGSMLKSVKVGILMGGVLTLSACSFFKSAECGSTDTRELVVSIISDKVKEGLAYGVNAGLSQEDIAAAAAQIALEINTIRTIGGGKDVGGFVCEGNLTANLNQDQIETASLRVADGDSRRRITGYGDFAKYGFDGNTLSTPISYNVQKTDDGSGLYAEVTDMNTSFIMAYASLALQAVKNAKVRDLAAEKASLAPAVASQELGPPAAVSSVEPSSVGAEPDPAPVSAAPAEIRPSFNCEKASSSAEKLICSDAELASLDVSLAEAYKQHLAVSADKAASKKAQVAWIKDLNSTCSDVDCMKAEYQARISVLSGAVQ